jgi:hypothetical protein
MYYDNTTEPYKNQSNEDDDDKLQFVICEVNFLRGNETLVWTKEVGRHCITKP